MANKRSFKKELTLVLEVVLGECVYIRDIIPAKTEEVDVIIQEALDIYSLTLSYKKIDENQSSKAYYSTIRNSYLAKMLEVVDKIEKLQKL